MKIKNYKLVYDSNDEAYDVYTDDLKSPMESSNGLHLGHIFIDDRFNLKKKWVYRCRNPGSVAYSANAYSANQTYQSFDYHKTKKKAVKALIREYNKLFREIFPLSLNEGNP